MVYYGFSRGFVFSYLSTGQEIGWKERLRYDLYCVRWDVKPQLNQSINVNRRFLLLFPGGLCDVIYDVLSFSRVLKTIWSMVCPCNKYVTIMHFVHFADVIGCNNVLLLKVCKSFCKLLEHLFYFILFHMCERHYCYNLLWDSKGGNNTFFDIAGCW